MKKKWFLLKCINVFILYVFCCVNFSCSSVEKFDSSILKNLEGKYDSEIGLIDFFEDHFIVYRNQDSSIVEYRIDFVQLSDSILEFSGAIWVDALRQDERFFPPGVKSYQEITLITDSVVLFYDHYNDRNLIFKRLRKD